MAQVRHKKRCRFLTRSQLAKALDRKPDLVALRALSAKQFPPRPRPLRALSPYYTRISQRHKEFVLGEKPRVLKHAGSLKKGIWRQYQVYLKRRPPIERAEFYVRELKERRVGSFRALSVLLGEPVERITRLVRLLKLPEPVKAILRKHREPEFLRYFTETRLGDLLKLRDARTVWRRFQEMIREAERETGIWKARDRGEGSVPKP